MAVCQGADIDSHDSAHCTPLLLAASKGCWETVQVLVAHGADVHVRDLNCRNFLHIAIRFGGKLGQFFRKKESEEVRRSGTVLSQEGVRGGKEKWDSYFASNRTR